MINEDPKRLKYNSQYFDNTEEMMRFLNTMTEYNESGQVISIVSIPSTNRFLLVWAASYWQHALIEFYHNNNIHWWQGGETLNLSVTGGEEFKIDIGGKSSYEILKSIKELYKFN